jgi:hypothetical protein
MLMAKEISRTSLAEFGRILHGNAATYLCL